MNDLLQNAGTGLSIGRKPTQALLFSPDMESSTIRTICAKQRNLCIYSIHTLQFTVFCGLSNYTIKLQFYKTPKCLMQKWREGAFLSTGEQTARRWALLHLFSKSTFLPAGSAWDAGWGCRGESTGSSSPCPAEAAYSGDTSTRHPGQAGGSGIHISVLTQKVLNIELHVLWLWLKCVCKCGLVTAAGAITKIYTFAAEVKQSTHKVFSKSH